MKNIPLLFFAFIFIGCQQEPLQEVAEQTFHYNHEIFEDSKLPPRATFFSFENKTIKEKENSKRFVSLNGEWKFHWVKDPKQRPSTFQNNNYDDSNWTTIPVPANWEVEGFGNPIYLDERYPFTTKWPDAPTDYNPVGTYRKFIDIDSEFLSEDVILHFAGAKSAMYLYINGTYVGYSQGSKTPAEFNITNYLKKGKNLIALQMFRWSDASYLESQDMLRMSGIEREVYLFTRPKIHVSDFHANTNLDNTFSNGVFKGTVSINNETDESISKKISVEIFDGEKSIFITSENVEIQANSINEFKADAIINEFKPCLL